MKKPFFRALIVGLLFVCVYYVIQIIQGMYLTMNYVPDNIDKYKYAKTVFVGCQLGPHIHSLGWDNWNNRANEQTVCYQEYAVKNAEAVRKQRVPWADCFEDGEETLDKEYVFAGTDFWK